MAFLIGIAGPSGAGKSTFCRRFERENTNVGRLKLDDFFCDIDDLDFIDGYQNWDDPKNIQWEPLIEAARKLKEDELCEVPHYDRAQDKCVGTKCILPKQIILVDGFLTLHHPELRNLFDTSFFFQLDEVNQIFRRKERQPWVEDGYIEHILLPNARKYVMPSSAHAHEVIDASLSKDDVFKLIESKIKQYSL